MPTRNEREYYRMGFQDAMGILQRTKTGSAEGPAQFLALREMERTLPSAGFVMDKPKRKLSAWNKFVKANSKKKIYRFANGKLKLKKMGIAFRNTRAGRKR